MSGTVQAVERAAAILRVLARGDRPLALAEVAGALGLAKPTAHGLLRTLKLVGFVEQEASSGRYRLAPEPLHVSAARLDPNELRSRAMNWTDALAARTGMAVRVGVLDGGDVLVVHHVFRPDDSAQDSETGQRLPAHATSLGRVLLAHAGDTPAPSAGPARSVATPRALAASLEAVRRSGWALDDEEWQAGSAGLAAPVRSPGGLVVGAVGVRGPVDAVRSPARVPHPPVLAQVLSTARAVSRELAT